MSLEQARPEFGEPAQTASSQRPPAPKSNRFKITREAFWTTASVISLVVNVILVVVVLLLVGKIFAIKQIVNDQLLGGLYNNFVLMDNARIQAVIPVETEVPAKFKLLLDTNTEVTLVEDVFIPQAHIANLDAGALQISNATLDIRLPKGTHLPIHLKLPVPVDKKIPVKLNVAVDIPLNQTDLHEPFVGLQQVVEPYYKMLNQYPSSWQEIFCGTQPNRFCRMLIP